MNALLGNFNKLSNSIREKAIRDIQHNLPDSQLVKWRKLLTAIWETEEAVQERYVDMADEPEALEAKRLMGGYSEATTDDDFSETVRDRLERL